MCFPSTCLMLQPVDRESLVFHLDTAAQRQRDDKELPDEFFEVTVDDVRKRFSQLKSERCVFSEDDEFASTPHLIMVL